MPKNVWGRFTESRPSVKRENDRGALNDLKLPLKNDRGALATLLTLPMWREFEDAIFRPAT